MEDTERLKLKRSQRNRVQESHATAKKDPDFLSICTYADKRDAIMDGLISMLISLKSI